MKRILSHKKYLRPADVSHSHEGSGREGGVSIILLVTIFSLFIPGVSHAGSFAIDPNASTVLFKAPYVEGYTIGMFKEFNGKVDLNDKNDAVVGLEGEIDLRTVNTLNWQRDRDLQGEELFDTIKFPTAKFKSKSADGKKVKGDLTLKGKTKEVVLDYDVRPLTNADGKTFALVTLTGEIKWKDFGIVSDRKMERGKPMMEDAIQIKAHLGGNLN